MVNRAAVLLRYKAPAIRWINEAEADPGPDSRTMTLAEVNQERTVYLISDEDAETEGTVKKWVRANWEALFEAQLEGWYNDTELWPQDRSFKQFNEWFDVEVHTVILDTVGGVIEDDES